MAWSRNKYHYAVRRAKKQADSVRAAELLQAAASGDRQLLQEMKKVIGKSKNGQMVPDCLEGATSEDDILLKFHPV